MNIKLTRFILRTAAKLSTVLLITATTTPAVAAAPLRIGFSDWPGWVAWQIALEKGWFKDAGVDVKFEWFDYSASMDAYSAGKLDAVNVTNGDALVMGATGAKSALVLITDYSNGNDMIIAKPGITSLKGLKGKKVGLEYGLVEHLLLINGLQKAGMKESDVTLVKAPTNELPQILAASDIAAVGAWQPISGASMKQVPGARAIYTSADEPGLIYDVLAVNPVHLAAHRADWLKVIKVWYRVVNYINDPKTHTDAVTIMAVRVGLTNANFEPLLRGTKILTLNDAKTTFIKSDGFKSIYGSDKIVDSFNVKYEIYKKPQDIDKSIDPSLTSGL